MAHHTDESEGERSGGDRGAGSVGERPELAGSRDDGDRSLPSARKHKSSKISDELDSADGNDPGLGG